MSNFIKRIRKLSWSPPPKTSTIIHVPRALHEMELERNDPRNPLNPNRSRTAVLRELVVLVVIKNAQGATNNRGLKELLQKETGEDIFRSIVPTCDDWEPTYYCGEFRYRLILLPSSDTGPFWSPYVSDVDHFSLFFNYDASSTKSWDEMVASYEHISSRCEDGIIPLSTIVAAMGEGSVSREEAEGFAQHRSCRFFQYSPVTGHGLCKAFAAIVEHAHGIRLRYATNPDALQATAKATAEVVQRLFSRCSM